MQAFDQKKVALGIAALLLLTIVAPVRLNWAKNPKDNFPLSYYPMFSMPREGKAKMTYLVGVADDNRRVYLSYKLAGTGGMNQVRKIIRKRAESQPQKLCNKVAKAVAKSSEYPGITQVKIVKGEFELEAFSNHDFTPIDSEIVCTCNVIRK
jgi:hypothetical protein